MRNKNKVNKIKKKWEIKMIKNEIKVNKFLKMRKS